MRDFTKPVAIMVTGTGPVDKRNLRAELDDWVFGPMEAEDSVESREVTIIFPIMAKPSPGMRFMVDWAVDVDADVQVFQTKGRPMTPELSGLPDIVVSDNERDTLQAAFDKLLELEKAGHETVFLMHYNEESVYTQGDSTMSDLEILCDAKNYTWLKTLNSEVMADTFPNYESTDDMLKREKLEAEFAKKEAEEKAASKPARKTAAPRKKAAPKKESTPVVNEPEKAAERVHEPLCALRKNHAGDCRIDISSTPADLSGLDKLIQESVEKDAHQPKALELKADVVLPSSKERQMLLKTVEPEDVWADVAKARPSAVELRRDELIAELGENIAAMGDAFSKTIRTYAALIEEVRNA